MEILALSGEVEKLEREKAAQKFKQETASRGTDSSKQSSLAFLVQGSLHTNCASHGPKSSGVICVTSAALRRLGCHTHLPTWPPNLRERARVIDAHRKSLIIERVAEKCRWMCCF
eukprot:117223-Amphidinium_carterae.1